MILLYMMIAPFVMVAWTTQPLPAFLFTLISATCFWSLELIAAELENPFGEDVNDLPVLAFQDDINHALELLLNPDADIVYKLKHAGSAELDVLTNPAKIKNLAELGLGGGDESHCESGTGGASNQLNEGPSMTGIGQSLATLAEGLVDQLKYASPNGSGGVGGGSQTGAKTAPVPGAKKGPIRMGAPPDQATSQNALTSITAALTDSTWIDGFVRQQANFERELLERLTQIKDALDRTVSLRLQSMTSDGRPIIDSSQVILAECNGLPRGALSI